MRRWWWAVAALAAVLGAGLLALMAWVRPEWMGGSAAPDQAQDLAASPGHGLSRHPLSLTEMLAGHSKDWRVARLAENQAVLVIEFPDLASQGAAMNRVAALLEKADAPRDRVLDDATLAALIARSGDNSQTFYQGHDYDGAGLARFYAQVALQQQPLNAQEQRLRALLVAQGLLAPTPAGGLQATGSQAVITFTATQKDDPATPVDESVDERRRESVLRHEISHGRYYTRPAYREHCRRFWRQTLTEAQREALRAYLASLGYDRRDDELMLNEAQAFVFHTPDTRAFSAEAVGLPDELLAEWRTQFWRTLPAEDAGDRENEAGAAPPVPLLVPPLTGATATPAAASRP